MPILEINKNGEDAEHHKTGKNAFLVHEGKKLRAAAPPREVGDGHSKVYDPVIRVKPSKAKEFGEVRLG